MEAVGWQITPDYRFVEISREEIEEVGLHKKSLCAEFEYIDEMHHFVMFIPGKKEMCDLTVANAVVRLFPSYEQPVILHALKRSSMYFFAEKRYLFPDRSLVIARVRFAQARASFFSALANDTAREDTEEGRLRVLLRAFTQTRPQ